MATFFSTIKDRRQRGPVDSLLLLKDYADAAISATASSTGLQVYPAAHEELKVVIVHDAITSVTPGSAEWVLTVSVSDLVGGTYTTVGSLTLGAAASENAITFAGETAKLANASAAFVRITATKTGSPGTLKYGAWIVPC
jgi:hypothetical protein